MTIENIPLCEKLMELFTDAFMKYCNSSDESFKEALFGLAPCFLRKWYNSSLLENSLLSPANIIDSYLSTNKGHKIFVSAIEPSSLSEDKVKIHIKEETSPGSIFLQDIASFINMFSPVMELSFKSFEAYKSTCLEKLKDKLFNCDMFYVEYISLLLSRLGTVFLTLHR